MYEAVLKDYQVGIIFHFCLDGNDFLYMSPLISNIVDCRYIFLISSRKVVYHERSQTFSHQL